MQLSSADEGSIGGYGIDVGDLWAATAPPVAATAVAASGSGSHDLVERAGEPEPVASQPLVKDAKLNIGRNEPCHCGSGKKFKNCHGR